MVQTIVQVFAEFGAKFDQTHVKQLTEPLPVDSLDNAYNYLVLIELAFGKQKAVDTYTKLTRGTSGVG